jgi:hypothetical protein
MNTKGTYVFCLVAASRRPSLRGVRRGPRGTGPVRLIEETSRPDGKTGARDGLKRWLVVADAPLDRFSESQINSHLHDLDWVARAALAHEGVVESFVNAPALLPMKLFTIFTSDERALQHVASDDAHVRAILKRVLQRDEWGVRVSLARARDTAASRTSPPSGGRPISGASYLKQKKALHHTKQELADRARDIVAELYDRTSVLAAAARRRGARDLPVKDGPLLLDATFLIDRKKEGRFKSLLAREARRLAASGFHLSVTGPWPPYSFLD